MAGTIGIKIANGDFYPIITEGNSTVKKRLVLTTAHDGQKKVQINLYRSISKSNLDAQYIGSLVVENIKLKRKEEPSIEMIISIDKDGNISADAHDLDAGANGKHHTLNVSLKTLDLADQADSSASFSLDKQETQTPSGLYDQNKIKKEEKRKFPWFIMVFAILFMALIIFILWFFLLDGKDSSLFSGKKDQQTIIIPPTASPIVPPTESPSIPPAPQVEIPAPAIVTPEPVPPPEPIAPPPPEPVAPPEPVVVPQPTPPPVVIQAPVTPPPARPQTVQRKRPPAPVSSYKVPATIPRNGAPYKIRWGDTLWDISEAFYRDPWLYPRIARFNNISNPDLIISGRTIRIPPRN